MHLVSVGHPTVDVHVHMGAAGGSLLLFQVLRVGSNQSPDGRKPLPLARAVLDNVAEVFYRFPPLVRRDRPAVLNRPCERARRGHTVP